MQPNLEIYWIPEPSTNLLLLATLGSVVAAKIFWPLLCHGVTVAGQWLLLGALLAWFIAGAIVQDLFNPAAENE